MPILVTASIAHTQILTSRFPILPPQQEILKIIKAKGQDEVKTTAVVSFGTAHLSSVPGAVRKSSFQQLPKLPSGLRTLSATLGTTALAHGQRRQRANELIHTHV